MPTYDYICDACQNEWEEFQSIMADATKKCPKCAKAKARRRIGAGGGIIFKGSGFYQTDYRSDSYKKAAEADTKGSSSAPAPASGSGSSESKSNDSAKPKSD